MSEMLSKLLNNEVFSEETKQEIAAAFKASLEEAKAKQGKELREEFARLYDTDKEKIAEAIQQYVDQKNESEMVEFHADMKSLSEQKMKYAKAQATLKEHAKQAIGQRLQVFEKAMRRALVKETKELHEDLKTNRSAALSAIREAKALSEADRQAFRVKGSKVIEHILRTQFDSKMRSLKEDIDKAKQNDFGSRIFEAFMGEARRLFFNSNKELRGLLKQMNEQQASFTAMKADMEQKLYETQSMAQKAINENRTIKESAIRAQKMNRMLSTLPAGGARNQMRHLLESAPIAKMEKTFDDFRASVLNESAKAPVKTRTTLEEHAVGLRNGNGRSVVVESNDDDEEIDQLRALAGIVRR